MRNKSLEAASCQAEYTGDAERVYGCNIKYQQYCSRSRSFDTRKIRRERDGIRRGRLLPFWRGSALRPASSLQKESWNSKWLSHAGSRAAMRGQPGEHHLAFVARGGMSLKSVTAMMILRSREYLSLSCRIVSPIYLTR